MNVKDPSKPSGPTEVGKLTVEINRETCIGASACIPPAEKTFALDDEAKAIVLATAEEDNEQALMDAARACPVQAIKIMRDGKQVVPE